MNTIPKFNKKNKTLKNKTLKNKIHKYISKKQDICCEPEINKQIVIQQIIEKYKKYCKHMNEPDEYLSYINNDLVKFIGYYIDLKKNNDKEGMKLWNEINQKMYKNKMINESKIYALLLNDVPLYFLLSFLGYADYTEHSVVI
jgi:hypothetical protein